MRPLIFGLAATLLAVIALSVPLPACSSCADIGCIPNVTITPEHPISEAGQYQVDFVADGENMGCSVKVPNTAPPKCTDERAYVYQESGRGILWLSVDGKIKDLSVTITHDGAPFADQTFSPSYEDVEFNGPGCGTCPAAGETLTLD